MIVGKIENKTITTNPFFISRFCIHKALHTYRKYLSLRRPPHTFHHREASPPTAATALSSPSFAIPCGNREKERHSNLKTNGRKSIVQAARYYLCITMKAMVVKKCWFSSICILEQREVKIPEMNDNEVMIKVCASGVNRGDIIDVVTSDKGVCPGLECSGIIEAVGRNVNRWKVGQRVCAILEGGGYAEKVVVPPDLLLPLSDDIDLDDAAGLPYASCSIWSALFEMCDPNTLQDKEILIREGTSWIGMLAIQYAKHMGLTVIASTGSRDKFSICQDYGADICLDHTSTNFVPEVVKRTEHLGVDFVLDYGASDLERNIKCCRQRGKVVILDLHGMERSSIDITVLQRKQAEIKVFDIRSRDLGYKAHVIAQVRTQLWSAILKKKIIPSTGNNFAAIEAQEALDLLKKNDSIGKIILRMNFEKTTRGHHKMEKTSGHLKMD